MNQDRYFTNSSSSKPLTATEGVETRKYSGNPLLREVDEQLKRLRSQFDKVATGTTPSANPISSSPTSGSYNSFSNCMNNVIQITPPEYLHKDQRSKELKNLQDRAMLLIVSSSNLLTLAKDKIIIETQLDMELLKMLLLHHKDSAAMVDIKDLLTSRLIVEISHLTIKIQATRTFKDPMQSLKLPLIMAPQSSNRPKI